MTMHVGFATPTPSVACSSFITSEEFGMEEHKIVSSRGTTECEDGGCGTKCI